jgi:hypothetical protein
MRTHGIMKYSGFVVAALLIYLYFNPPEAIKKRRQLFEGTACIAGLVKLEKKVEKNWKLKCVENNLQVNIVIQTPTTITDMTKKRAYFFSELANNLVFISKNTPEANLENMRSIHVVFSGNDFVVEALTRGSSLAKLKNLNSPESIKEHLKNTVQVKETVK